MSFSQIAHLSLEKGSNRRSRKNFARNILVVVFALSLGLSAGNSFFINKAEASGIDSQTLVNLTNESRAQNGMKTLTRNSALDAAAELKAKDMATNDYFAHNSPAGVTPWHWFNEVGYKYSYAGENLAINFNDSNSVEEAWMNSPTHRANILNENYNEIGMATYAGYYNGEPTIYIVEEFGSPKGDTPDIVKEVAKKTESQTTTATPVNKELKPIAKKTTPPQIKVTTNNKAPATITVVNQAINLPQTLGAQMIVEKIPAKKLTVKDRLKLLLSKLTERQPPLKLSLLF